MNWQPIETAPKDGTDILIRRDGWIFSAFADPDNEFAWTIFDGHDFICLRREYAYPTHWMKLPDPPKD